MTNHLPSTVRRHPFVLLAAALLALCLTACSSAVTGSGTPSGPVAAASGATSATPSGATSSSGGSASPSGSASPTPSPTPTKVTADAFVTPSKNITCFRDTFSVATIYCGIVAHQFTTPACVGDPAAVAGLQATDDIGFISGCGGEYLKGGADRTVVPVTYGTTIDLGPALCTVESVNVRCVNSAGHGFTLARESYTVF
jgi:hypothetical protein